MSPIGWFVVLGWAAWGIALAKGADVLDEWPLLAIMTCMWRIDAIEERMAKRRMRR